MLVRLFLLLLLTGCAAEPRSTGAFIFDGCKVADGVTTMVAVRSGKFVELNPLLKGIVGGGVSWLPFGLVVTAVILAYNWADNSGYINTPTTIFADGVTCGVAARNIFLMTR